jgi:hypothetical protein
MEKVESELEKNTTHAIENLPLLSLSLSLSPHPSSR